MTFTPTEEVTKRYSLQNENNWCHQSKPTLGECRLPRRFLLLGRPSTSVQGWCSHLFRWSSWLLPSGSSSGFSSSASTLGMSSPLLCFALDRQFLGIPKHLRFPLGRRDSREGWSGYAIFLPCSSLMTISTNATTSSMWISPPQERARPSTHRAKRTSAATTIRFQSILASLLFIGAISPPPGEVRRFDECASVPRSPSMLIT